MRRAGWVDMPPNNHKTHIHFTQFQKTPVPASCDFRIQIYTIHFLEESLSAILFCFLTHPKTQLKIKYHKFINTAVTAVCSQCVSQIRLFYPYSCCKGTFWEANERHMPEKISDIPGECQKKNEPFWRTKDTWRTIVLQTSPAYQETLTVLAMTCTVC